VVEGAAGAAGSVGSVVSGAAEDSEAVVRAGAGDHPTRSI
jgi:hypothetical protein